MKFNGTQGKWEIYGISDDLIEIYSVESQKPIFDVQPYTKKTESYSNAKLIQTAPEMLNMMHKIVSFYKQNGNLLSFDIKQINDLISEATTI